jgi:hypothetical protein
MRHILAVCWNRLRAEGVALLFPLGMAYLAIRVALLPEVGAARPDRWACLIVAVGLGLAWWAGLASLSERAASGLDQRPRLRRLVVAAALLGLLALQATIGLGVETVRWGWDPDVIRGAALAMAAPRPISASAQGYLLLYPNNGGVVLLLGGALRAVGLLLSPAAVPIACLLVGGVAVVVAVGLTYAVAGRLLGTRAGLLALALAGALLATSPWGAVAYSDSLAAPFPVLVFYLGLRAFSAPSRLACVLLGLAAGLAAAVGFLVKPSTAVVLLALLAVWSLAALVGPNRRRAALVSGLLVTTVALTVSAAERAIASSRVLAPHPDLRRDPMPIENWVLLGLDRQSMGDRTLYGAWNPHDTQRMLSLPTVAARRTVARQVIGGRLKAFGPLGYLRYLHDKAVWVLSDGTFYAYGEGTSHSQPFVRHDPISRAVQSVFFLGGRWSQGWVDGVQAVWLLVLALLAWPLVGPSRRRSDFAAHVLRLSLAGALAYVLAFEGRSRYLFIFVPIIVLAAVQALGEPAPRPGVGRGAPTTDGRHPPAVP